MNKEYIVTVIDGQGGSLGRSIVKRIKHDFPEVKVLAIGTNGLATSNMIKSGADYVATGENPVVVAARNNEVLIGAFGIIVADSLHGEITPKMAKAVGESRAHKILIPIQKCNVYIAGTPTLGLDFIIDDAINNLRKKLVLDGIIKG